MRIVNKPANNTGEFPYRVKGKFSSLSAMKIISTIPYLIILNIVFYQEWCCVLPNTGSLNANNSVLNYEALKDT